ncbi:MAG: NUDIX domain-containing protein [Candidatus Saccharimonas sp.]
MFDQDDINHHIERSILSYLMTHEYARFRDLRPEGIETNLFSYHLKLLQKSDYVTKTEKGYMLSRRGLVYVDRVNAEKMRVRTQPKIITMLLVQDGYGKVLLQRRTKQPYINTWTLPYGKLHIDDISVVEAARRESIEKLNFDPHRLHHVGDCYITVMSGQQVAVAKDNQGLLEEDTTIHLNPQTIQSIETRTLVHIVRFDTDAITAADDLQWTDPLDLPKLKLAPAVEQIVTRAFFGDTFFFEEFIVQQ